MKLLHTTAQRRKFVQGVTTAVPYVLTFLVYISTYAAWRDLIAVSAEKPERTFATVASGVLAIALTILSILVSINWIGTFYEWVKNLHIARRIEKWIDDGADTYE